MGAAAPQNHYDTSSLQDAGFDSIMLCNATANAQFKYAQLVSIGHG